ncbi:CvpA family protein [Algoriphagus sediminis]|uniref:CvpA family protein n=1 Tax=Algoriphagus sediminis TaxID=3057113 RepID=A0ABT7YFL3_9BACT|nr:CvpA family protein [Algoriphagus sediminis]MDN3204989.1 CvpA family protein [Algoriphagus sediminis]
MEIIDVVILIIIGLGALEGFKKGFLMGIIGLFGFIIAIILAFYFMDTMADWLSDNVKSLNIGYPIVAFFLIFVLTTLLINGVGWLLKKTMETVFLGSLDKVAGLMLGVVRVAFFLSLFLYMANLFDLDLPKEWTRKSQALPYIEPIAPFFVDLLDPFLPVIQETLDKMEELVEEFADQI